MLVWRREMAIGSYAPRWISARAGDKTLRAIAFVVNHAHPHYAGKLPLDTVIKTLATAKGRFGSGADYLYQTVDCLADHGINDAYLTKLRIEVMKHTHGVHHPIACPETGA
jgi:cation transport protein ChaC